MAWSRSKNTSTAPAKPQKQTCGICGWWYQNPLHPERTLGLCSVETGGVVNETSDTTRKSYSCKKWEPFDDVKPVFAELMLHNQSPDGCKTCLGRIRAYKTELCLKSTFVGISEEHLHYRKCSLMSPRMCRYGRWTDAMNRFLKEGR